MRRKAPRTVHTPSCKSFLLLMHYSAGQAGRCTTQLSRWFMGNKGRCQRGLLHNGSIKSRAEQWLNSHMAIATVGGERESPLDCGRTLKDCGHSVLLYHSVLCFFVFFKSEAFICRVAPKSWLPGARPDWIKQHFSDVFLSKFSLQPSISTSKVTLRVPSQLPAICFECQRELRRHKYKFSLEFVFMLNLKLTKASARFFSCSPRVLKQTHKKGLANVKPQSH